MTDATIAPDLTALTDDFWRGWLAFHPIGATATGIPGYDDRLPDPSAAAIATRVRELNDQLARAREIDATRLETADATTLDALVSEIEAELAAHRAEVDAWTVDPLEGPVTYALDIPAFQPDATPEQGRAMVERWRGFGEWFDRYADNLRRALADGRVAVRTPVRKVIEGGRAALARPVDGLPLLEPARDDHADWPTHELQAFRDDLRAAVESSFRPGLERYLAVLETEVLPAARPDERPGIVHLPGGEMAYQSLIRVHTSLDLSAEAIHRIGLDEVERIDREMAELGGRVLHARGLDDVLERLRSDTALYFSTRDEVFDKAADALARAADAIPDWFGILPKAPCEVVRMGEHEEAHSTIAYYRQPAVDGSRPGQYFINTGFPETRPRYEAEVLAYHESIPGHHLQIAIGQELTDLPDFRRHLGPTAFFEGWGLYTERLSDEMGLYSGDLDRIGTLSFDGWRACRLVVDTGMHALGWTRQAAIDFMAAHTALGRNNIENEVDRYIVWPGQALAYKLGQLEMLRLRDEARARLGARFDIRSFHDAILGEGALGLAALRRSVERRLA